MTVAAAAIMLELEADQPDAGRAVAAILEGIERVLDGVTTCETCGCLCRPSEHCPVCQPWAWT